jgi:hypothetical protein
VRGRGLGIVVAAALGLGALAAPAAAQQSGFRVGAATVDTTPPAWTPESDAMFAPCAGAAFPGPRKYQFQEPYVDGNTNGTYDYPEPFCDRNANQKYDGMYLSGAVNAIAAYPPHDPIDARAVAVSDGAHTYVLISVVAQGIFENYIRTVRAQAKALEPGITDVVVSSNHNESSPDTVGIYGAPEIPVVGVGARSSVNEYYMDWLAGSDGSTPGSTPITGKLAQLAVAAYRDLRPASVWARQVELPKNLKVNLSNNFPTTFDSTDKPASIDPKMRIVQARDSAGKPIATLLGLAAHNQQTGHSGQSSRLPDGSVAPLNRQISSDWPGYFHRKLEADGAAGVPIFFAGENGSEEDPITVPSIQPDVPECFTVKNGTKDLDGCHEQNQATGEALAAALEDEAPKADRVPFGALRFTRKEFDVPVENNAFKAAFFAGLFGERKTYGAGMEGAGLDVRTYANVLDVGPALQVLTNPGEAFPALMNGSPFGQEEATCPNRPNPPAPVWRAKAPFRFQVGLADDLIGYEIPAWAYFEPGVFTTDECDFAPEDPKGHAHKLEAEGIGPTASNMVAQQLTDAVSSHGADPTAEIRQGRFLKADGTLTRRPAGAVAVWLADKGATSLAAGKGTIVALDGYTGFGARAIDSSGRMMDFDGVDQEGAGDVLTRGMVVFGCNGAPSKRYYVDVFPPLSAPAKLSEATRGSVGSGCGAGLPEVGTPGNPDTGPPLVAGGGGSDSGPVVVPPGCRDRTAPRTTIRRSRIDRRGFGLSGQSADRGCAQRVGAVLVSVARVSGKRCLFLQANGRLAKPRNCRRPVLLRARGTSKWKLSTRVRLPRGTYRIHVRSVDVVGNKEKPSSRNRRLARLR